MKIPYGYCSTNGVACPSLGQIKGEACSRQRYWKCIYFKRAGVTTVSPDDIKHFEGETIEGLIREYNTGQY